MATVSIILPVYNGEKTIAKAIQSMLNQSFTDWELLILDDGSTDQTKAAVLSFNDLRIKWIANPKEGIVTRLNQGIALATGKYIARMDADDVAHITRLEKQIEFLESHPNVDLVGTAIRLVNAENEAIGTQVFATTHRAIVAHSWLKTISIAHPTWCGKATWFKKWQYREGYSRNEDQELLLRAATSSTYANLPEVLLDYRLEDTWQKRYAARRGWLKVLWHHFGKQGKWLPFLFGAGVTLGKIGRDWVRQFSL